MSLLLLSEARALVETDLNDLALQMLIDDAEAEIISQIGSTSSQVEDFADCYDLPVINLARKASSITTIVEKIRSGNDYITTTLATNDYSLRYTRILERLASGTNPRCYWGHLITVTYVPIDDSTRRKIVVADLLKLAIAYNGLDSQRIGDYSETQKAYQTERNMLISRLGTFNL